MVNVNATGSLTNEREDCPPTLLKLFPRQCAGNRLVHELTSDSILHLVARVATGLALQRVDSFLGDNRDHD